MLGAGEGEWEGAGCWGGGGVKDVRCWGQGVRMLGAGGEGKGAGCWGGGGCWVLGR